MINTQQIGNTKASRAAVLRRWGDGSVRRHCQCRMSDVWGSLDPMSWFILSSILLRGCVIRSVWSRLVP